MIGLIPARKGSVRIPDKALKEINGKPLLYWTLLAAEASKLKKYYLTSDYTLTQLDQALDLEQFIKLKVIQRPKELCSNTSPASDYIKHFIETENIPDSEAVCLLQCTCPLRREWDIDEAISAFNSGLYPTLVSGFEIFSNYVYDKQGKTIYGTKLDKNNTIFIRNSAIYIFAIQYFNIHNTIFGSPTSKYTMPMQDSLDINYLGEFLACEKLMKDMMENEFSTANTSNN